MYKDRYKLLLNNLWQPNIEKITKLQAVNQQKSPILRTFAPKILQVNPLQVNPAITPHIIKPKESVITLNEPYIIQEAIAKTINSEINQTDLVKDWQQLINSIQKCQACNLYNNRITSVIGRGNPQANWMFIGEQPNSQENQHGIPFHLTKDGKLLDKMIENGLKLDINNDVYITKVLKCSSKEGGKSLKYLEQCKHFLFEQIKLVNPKIIILMDNFAIKAILNSDIALSKLRGKLYYYNDIKVIVTHPPSQLIVNPQAKKEAWEDLQLAIKNFN